MFYSNYRGRCMGRIIFFITQYCGSVIGDAVRIGNNVQLYDQVFAEIDWQDEFGWTDVPVFKFNEEHPEFSSLFNDNQANWKEIALTAARVNNDIPEDQKPVDAEILRILIWNGYLNSNLRAQALKNPVRYYIGWLQGDRNLFCEIGSSRYIWRVDLSNWLYIGEV